MSEKRKTDFSLNRLDDLFTSQSERENGLTPTIKDIPLEKLVPFPNHPFKVRDDEEMNKLVESVSENGVLVPAIVREKDNGDYEIISGHRRKFASEIAGKSTLRCIVSNLDDDAATVIMVDSNIQRENILPSEKAFAYKMKLDAMKHQGKRTDLTSNQLGRKWTMQKQHKLLVMKTVIVNHRLGGIFVLPILYLNCYKWLTMVK